MPDSLSASEYILDDYCADEKHNPEYYARHTVPKAQAHLQTTPMETFASDKLESDPKRRPTR